jgi:2-oxoglutarate-dependent dioxygenase
MVLPDPIPRRRLDETQLRFYQEEGYTLLPGLLTAEQAAALRREVLDILALIGLPMTKLKQTHEYLKGSGLDALVNSPNLRLLAEQLLGGPATLYLPFTAVKSGGGGGRFHFHQDNQYTRWDGPGINLWIALERMTPENGCLQIVPRSHLHGTLESMPSVDGDSHRMVTFEPEDFLQVRMEPGDCVAFSRLTVHGSGQNVTPEPRIAYALQFHRNDARWLKDGEWLLLTEHPRWSVGPVERITVPTEARD